MVAPTDPAKLRDAVKLYKTGLSALEVSQRTGVDRGALTRALRDAGVQVRGRSAAGKLRAGKMTAAERKRQAAAANAAVRGVPAVEHRLVKAAQTKERRLYSQSDGERQLMEWVKDLHPVGQKAVGRYNVDLAVAPVAVEVLGGEWHGYKRHHASRTKHIADAGWALLFVWNTANYPLTLAASDYLRTFVKEARINPSLIGEYRVIRGDGQLVSVGRADGEQFTVIPPARDLSGID